MDSYYRPTRAEISLDALRHNLFSFRQVIPKHIKLMAVVKANAYGHGALQISKEALDCGVDYLAVAFLDEALELRKAGIQAPILVLGYTPPDGIQLAIKHRISLTVYSEDVLQVLEQRVSEANQLTIHMKIDTGMNRLGIYNDQQAIDFVRRALRIPGLHIEGLFTHYACADERDKSYTYMQHDRFTQTVEKLRSQGVEFPIIHAGNSATGIDMPELSFNMVRLGISMYGLYPSNQVNRERVRLQPVMSFKTAVVRSEVMPLDSGVSYGGTYHTKEDERIATLPVGYADGYSRLLSSNAEALICGVKVPVVGRVCMDQCMLNVTGLDDVSIGEEVVLFGTQGDAVISADDLAQRIGTINYEITCKVSHRVPRVYIRDGKQVEVANPLH